MNIVITGHKGLIGHYLEEKLKKRGHKIILAIDRKEGKELKDLENIKLDEKVDLMIHAAAHCKINQSISNPKTTFRDNVLGTFQVLEFCRKNKIPKILFFSSSRILSKEKNPYTASKIFGEELCKGYHDCYGVNYLIIRPSTVYGPFWDETKRLMHLFITKALNNEDLEIYGDPKTKTLDFTYIDDFIEGVMLALGGSWNKEYNISGDGEFNIFELAKLVIKLTNSKSQIKICDAEIAQPQKVNLDLSEIKKRGYNPRIHLPEGVKNCVEWYKDYLKENPNKSNSY